MFESEAVADPTVPRWSDEAFARLRASLATGGALLAAYLLYKGLSS